VGRVDFEKENNDSEGQSLERNVDVKAPSPSDLLGENSTQKGPTGACNYRTISVDAQNPKINLLAGPHEPNHPVIQASRSHREQIPDGDRDHSN
jgi:hypothetical protein